MLTVRPREGYHPRSMPIDIEKIKALREKKGLTQVHAAKLAGLANRQHWNQIESGLRDNLTIKSLEKVAEALGVRGKDLLK